MAAIKSFTSLEQSKKLEEILPLESADMCYHKEFVTTNLFGVPMYEYKVDLRQPNRIIDWTDKCIPCWSLAALLGVLPDGTDIIKDKVDTENEKYMCTVGVKDDIISTFADNPVDACVAMIEKLHELKML